MSLPEGPKQMQITDAKPLVMVRPRSDCGRLRALEMPFAPFASLPFDDAAARHYASLRHEPEQRGRMIGPNDLKIAAIARAHALVLVSSDEAFIHVPGLSVEDWGKA